MRYLLIFLILASCTANITSYDSFGEEITSRNSIEVNDFLAKVSDQASSFKVKATIEEVCQMKGCWITLRNEQGANIRVTFKDYGFFVPKNISGKEVIIEGIAQKEMIEEDLAKHYADDSNKEYDESMRNAITFVAEGVLVAKS